MNRRRLAIFLACLIALLCGPVILPRAVSVAAPTTSGYVPLAGANLLDTTRGVGAPLAPMAPRETLTMHVAGSDGVPATGVSAVKLTLIAVHVGCPSSYGWLTVYPTGTPRPSTANMDFLGCDNASGSAIVALGANGGVDIYNGSWKPEDVVVNIQGYYRSGSPVAGSFVPLPGRNLLNMAKDDSAAAPGSTTNVQIAGRAGVPADAAAVAVTVFGDGGFGWLTVYPTGTARPHAATVDLETFFPSALALIPLGRNGEISIYNGSKRAVQLVVNVTGYVVGGTPQTPGSFVPIPAANLLNANDVFARGGTTVEVTGRAGVPATGVSAVTVMLAAVHPRYSGWATAYADGTPRPRAASLEFDWLARAPYWEMPWAVSNVVTVPVGANGKIAITNGSGAQSGFVVNVLGYYRA